jgi:hypothetical protein
MGVGSLDRVGTIGFGRVLEDPCDRARVVGCGDGEADDGEALQGGEELWVISYLLLGKRKRKR